MHIHTHTYVSYLISDIQYSVLNTVFVKFVYPKISTKEDDIYLQ